MIVRRIGVAVAALALATVAACGSSHPNAAPAAKATSSSVPGYGASVSPTASPGATTGSPSAPASPTGSASPAKVQSIKLATLDGKQVVVDQNGRALYLFANDRMNTSTCVDACAATWPPLLGPVTGTNGVQTSDLSTLTRPDNTKQVAFFGTPLYYYIGDTGPGTANGQGLNLNGGLWYLVNNKGKAAK